MKVINLVRNVGPLALVLSCVFVYACPECDDYEDGSDLSVAELVQLRGFIAEEYKLNMTGGWRPSLVRILNPLINEGKRGACDRKPILFVHGAATSGAAFLVNSLNAKPRDFRSYDAQELNSSELSESIKEDPVSKSLPLLASCLGYEPWILTRRGSWESVGHKSYSAYKRAGNIGQTGVECFSHKEDPSLALGEILAHYQQTSIDPRYWNYSLDEQAAYDLPEAINLILKVTGHEQVAYVGHSLGSAMGLMMLSTQPSVAQKVSTLILLSPTLYRAHAKSASDLKYYALDDVLLNYTGPLSNSEFITPQVQCLIDKICGKRFGKENCHSALKEPCTRSGDEGNDDKIVPIFESYSGPQSSKEILQMVQSHNKKKMHFLDLESANETCDDRTPLYDVKKIKLNSISVFHGSHDAKATPEDVKALIKDLPASTKDYYFDEGLCFSHISPYLHHQVSTLVNIPAMNDISIS